MKEYVYGVYSVEKGEHSAQFFADSTEARMYFESCAERGVSASFTSIPVPQDKAEFVRFLGEYKKHELLISTQEDV